MKYFLSAFPPPDKIFRDTGNLNIPDFRNSNCNIHTQYDPSGDNTFMLAKNENISVLGINDYLVTDGFDYFHDGCIKHGIFPLFNMSIAGLLKEEQNQGIRINDPLHPGRIYISAKGLDYPFDAGWIQKRQLNKLRKSDQVHLTGVISKLNELIKSKKQSLHISYDLIRKEVAGNFVHEHHVSRTLLTIVKREFPQTEDHTRFIQELYKAKMPGDQSDKPATEEEIIRKIIGAESANISDGPNNFPDLKKLLKIILSTGGIPFYTVQLDSSGSLTEFEKDKKKMAASLRTMGIQCIEFIPAIYNPDLFIEYVKYFNNSGFIITFGTKNNSSETKPLKILCSNSCSPDDWLLEIAWNGACIIAAHQYLRASGRQGYILPDGSHSLKQKKELIVLGKIVIEYFLNNLYEQRSLG